MARRKRVLDDGDDSDSSNNSDANAFDDFDNHDPDLKEGRALFENPYQRKRRRKNGKEDAIYGVFGDDSEDEQPARNRGGNAKRSDWTKAPAFVSSDKKVDLDKTMDVDLEEAEKAEDSGHDEENENELDMDDADSSDGSPSEGEDDQADGANSDESPAPPRVRVEEEEPERPRFGGLGSFKSAQEEAPAGGMGFSKGGIGSSKGGIGPSRGGLGAGRGGIGAYAAFMNAGASTSSSNGFGRDGIDSSQLGDDAKEASSAADSARSTPDIPSAFGNRQQRFNRDSTSTPKPVALSAEEMAHFSKLHGSFGARMLSKMGWQAGTGLGASGEGIVAPVEAKPRPQKMGIAFKGFREKTDQAKREAKRRGEVVSEDEEEHPAARKQKKKAKEAQQKRSDVWKKPKKVKTKVEHKTYEQILAESGEAPAPVGLGQIIDATGAVPREVSSLSEISLSTWAPSYDLTRIPEVRHNIRLIADACKSDLDGLAREAKALQERKKFVIAEDARLRKKVEEEAELISRMQQIQLVANEIQILSKELSSMYEVSLEPFSPLVHQLVDRFSDEFDKYQLDEVVVGAIAPLLRRLVAAWSPLEEPANFLAIFRNWRRALKVNSDNNQQISTEVDVYGAKTISTPRVEDKPMTAFESLLWNVWLPKVRTVVNNEWGPENAQPAVKLYESWSSFLPQFIRDNMLDQLFLPKVRKAVVDWNPKRSNVSLQSIVFPWLPHIGLRLDDLLEDAKRKVKSVLKNWTMTEAKPEDLHAWKDVFGKGEWDAMMLKYAVPKLGASLRNDFRVNPRAQNMEPLQRVLAWVDLLRPSVFSQILETEFFQKWLDVLHIWLIQPKVSFEEVAQWYQFWKDTFPESIWSLSGVNRGFTRGLQLMNKAIELGPDAPTRLQRPDFRAELAAANAQASSSSRGATKDSTKSTTAIRPSSRTQEITFRSIVEEYAADQNLLFIPTGRAHEKSRTPLYRISGTADGKHGLLVYILDDAVWAPQPGAAAMESEAFRAISLDEMIARAKGSG